MKNSITKFLLVIGFVLFNQLSATAQKILPTPPSTTYNVYSGQNKVETDNVSITLKPGVHVRTGANFHAYLTNVTPSAPSGLTATALSTSEIKLTWVDNATYETGFKVERSTSPGSGYSLIFTSTANATSYNNTGLSPNTTYYYRIRAFSSAGQSVYKEANATTFSMYPDAPTSLTAATISISQIDLTWTDNSDNETGFVIEQATSASGPFSPIFTTAANVTSYSNTGLTGYISTFYYRVRAINVAVSSSFSNIAQATLGTPMDPLAYQALVDLYNSTDGDNWNNNENWLQGTTIQEVIQWHGVIFNGEETLVTSILLADNNLNGTIPSSIGNLTNLISLDLSRNNITGIIPSTIDATNLWNLVLYDNQITGSIPSSIGNLTNLTTLRLDGNKIEGSIPTTIGNLVNLLTLNLRGNQITGSIPTTIGNLTGLSTLDISGNLLNGTIPSTLGNILLNPLVLNLSVNDLTGEIPSTLGNLVKCTYMNLSQNQLTGSGAFLSMLGNLTSLTHLDLSSNEISGTIPSNIGNLTAITYLSLEDNQISGAIPSSIGNLTNLTRLYLGTNQLSGSIPTTVGNLTNLLGISFEDNELSGLIPSELGNITNLTGIDLSQNQLIGDIPAFIVNFINLRSLELGSNQFTGEIPETMASLTQLEKINLSDNLLSGEIPTNIVTLSKLGLLTLYFNKFTSFPDFSGLPHAGAMIVDIRYNCIPQPDIDANIVSGVPVFNIFSYNSQTSCGNYGGRVSSSRILSTEGDIENIEEGTELIVYPNPSRGVFAIQSSLLRSGVQLEIVDNLNRNVRYQVLQKDRNKVTIDIDGATGVYFIRIYTEEGVATKKVVVN